MGDTAPTIRTAPWTASVNRREGLSLLELLIAITLIASTAAVVATAFAAGLKVYDRAQQLGGPYGGALLAHEVMQRDLRNTVLTRLSVMRGEKAWIEIPSVVRRQAPDDAGEYLGIIRYEYVRNTRSLDRVVFLYLAPDRSEQRRETLATGLEGIEFAYGERGAAQSKGEAWRESWTSRTNVPGAVRVAIRITQGGEQRELRQTVAMPR